MSEYPHLHVDVAKKMMLSDDERIEYLKKDRWLGYKRAKEVLVKLEDLLKHPTVTRMPNMLIVAESNNGKTHLIKRFCSQHSPDENIYGEHIIAPVLFFEAPEKPSITEFYADILECLFEQVPTRSGTSRQLRERVIHVFKNIGLKILVIDEMHNMLAGSSTKQQQFLNAIKHLTNKLQISMVGCGTSDIIRGISIDPQIQNRFTPEVLPKWKMDKDFKELLVSFEHVLPLKKVSNLHKKELALKLFAMSEGTIGELSTLLNKAAIYAISNKIESIDQDVLNKCGYVSPSDRIKIASLV